MAFSTFKSVTAAVALFLSCGAQAGPIDDGLKGCGEHAFGGWPVGAEGTPVCRLGYALLHDDERKIPAWSSYRLTAAKATACLSRTNDFRPDRELPLKGQAQLSDYKGSGYDRGHIVPAGDMQWSKTAMSQSFLLSNMSPQLGSFNRGIWKELETRVRIWARDRGDIIVIDGPYFEGQTASIGSNKVAVPAGFFKIAFDPETNESQAFALPHGKIPSKDLPHYQVSVREVETRSGLDFFPGLPKASQDKLEETTAAMWPADVRAWIKERKVVCPADKD